MVVGVLLSKVFFEIYCHKQNKNLILSSSELGKAYLTMRPESIFGISGLEVESVFIHNII